MKPFFELTPDEQNNKEFYGDNPNNNQNDPINAISNSAY